MERVALYIRVSSEEQAIHGLSIGAQTEALDSWAKKNNVKVVGHYVDAGISARKPASKRPALQKLLEDVRKGKIDLIAFTKLDRWFRNIAEYYKVQEVLEKYHVNWKTISEDYDTSTSSGRLKVNIMLSVAQDEADRTGERIKAVFESKVQKGEPISGKIPLGYKIENKHLVIDEETAPIVQDIFSTYLAIRSIRALRKYIMDTHKITYCHTNICALLQNRRYIGEAHNNVNFCPPIIDRDTFDRVQDIIAVRAERVVQARDPNRVYLFTGLAYCAECGNRLSAHIVRKKYIYYRCTKYDKLHLCTHKKRTSERVLEDWLVKNLGSCIAAYNEEIVQKKLKAKPSVNIDSIKSKMEKLKDLYLNDLIDRDMYERDFTALRDQLSIAQSSQEEDQTPVNLEELSSALEMYPSLSRQGKKEFWSRAVKKIVITNSDEFFIFHS